MAYDHSTMAHGHNPYGTIAHNRSGTTEHKNSSWHKMVAPRRCSQHQQRLATYGGERLTQLCCLEPARRFNRSSSNSSESFKTLFGEESKHYRCCNDRGHMRVRCLLLDNALVQAGWVGGEDRGVGWEVVHGLCAAHAQLPSFNTGKNRPKNKNSLPSIGHGKSGAR